MNPEAKNVVRAVLGIVVVLAIAIAASFVPVSAQEIPRPVRDTPFDWRCVGADGTEISKHTRQDTAIYSCQSAAARAPGAVFYIEGGRYRVTVAGEPDPEPDPDPTPEPDPDPTPVESVTDPLEQALRVVRASGSPVIETDQSSLDQAGGRWQVCGMLRTLSSRSALASRDAAGIDEPGHISIWIRQDGAIEGRVQSTTGGTQVISGPGEIVAGSPFCVTVSFGSRGVGVFNGASLVAADGGFVTGVGPNSNPVVVGAGCQSCSSGTADNLKDVSDFEDLELAIFEAQADFEPPILPPDPDPVTGEARLSWSWEDPAFANTLEGFTIRKREAGGDILFPVGPGKRSHTFDGLPAGEHCFDIRARAGGKVSEWSLERCKTIEG